jgi:1-phosphatidylinositol phosphodiesterase
MKGNTIMPTVNALNWMSAIDDTMPIHQLSIPGTHESCARYGGPLYKCQNLNITEQLERGIRFLDIRCKYYAAPWDPFPGDCLPVHHADQYQNIHLCVRAEDGASVQEQCVDFLTKHPSETILMNLQLEDSDEGVSFGLAFQTSVMGAVPGQFTQRVAPNWYLGSTIPTLQEARGKIVLIRANDPDNPHFGWSNTDYPDLGLEWAGFKHDDVNNYKAPFATQDLWSPPNGTKKGDLVEATLRDAVMGQKHPGWIYLNFLSYANTDIPNSASNMNNRILKFIQEDPIMRHTPRNRLGVLAMDFCGNTGEIDNPGALENVIIAHNTFMDGYKYSAAR